MQEGHHLHSCSCCRSLTNLIRSTAGSVSIPLNRQDESRANAIERELIKLGSNVRPLLLTALTDPMPVPQTNMEVVRYSLVHWEQLMGEPPDILSQSSQCDLNSEDSVTIATFCHIAQSLSSSHWSTTGQDNWRFLCQWMEFIILHAKRGHTIPVQFTGKRDPVHVLASSSIAIE